MAFQGFGKHSGPGGLTGSQAPSFGNSPQSTVPARPLPRPLSHLSQFQMVRGQNHSPRMDFQRDSFEDGPRPSFAESQLANLSRSTDILNNHLSQPAATTVSGRSLIKHGDTQAFKRSRSPTLLPSNNTPFEEPSIAFHDSHSESHQEFSAPSSYNIAEITNSRKSFPIAKKTKLPSISSYDRDFHGAPLSIEDESNRELDAKAKRLLRFKAELDEPTESDLVPKNQKGVFKKQQLPLDEGYMLNSESHTYMDSSRGSVLSDYDGMSSSSIIIGSCLDMCPESERSSRERKGDLDSYERVDGDRNQTSKSLAIKKYTRTAEREAELIRPMPILQKTMDYLLNLLDQPYNDRFLGLYNFLWDRMRAIRMDLRMQHIFSREAMTMLEQMIRLHIIAMHELCEYTKGEGFSEGFDAHLNIEQMNKTSVELFQLYDDLRKNGVHVETEKEFRGFYALLKLDKHPGYKVEPAELSLDLAKMTPDMRQTREIIFAREVARACRTGNYIAFFRLAQKATYLQACLMHAHFSKLRTQALAALHGGLQMNQGIPVAHVAKWLGMEEEDIEELVEYHGFSLREFEVPYMVKEGPFLNVDSDYPVKCSRLVHLKKSTTIVNDVAYSSQVKPYPLKEKTAVQPYGGIQQIKSVTSFKNVLAVDEKMPDRIASPKASLQKSPLHNLHSVASPKTGIQKIPMLKLANDKVSVLRGPPSPRASPTWYSSSLAVDDPERYDEAHVESPRNSKYDIHFRNSLGRSGSVDLKEARVESPRNSKYDIRFRNSLGRSGSVDLKEARVESPRTSKYNIRFRNSLGRSGSIDLKDALSHSISGQMEIENTLSPVVESVAQQEEHLGLVDLDSLASGDELVSTFNDEVFEAKLKLVLRIWKRLASKKRESREQRKLLSHAALTSLPLGLPISRREIMQSSPSGDYDIDIVTSNRFANQKKSWAKLNVAEVVSSILNIKNPNSKCLCWKLLLCIEENSYYRKDDTESIAKSWLLSKLIPRSLDLEDHSGLSFSSSWVPSCSNDDPTCCVTVVRGTTLQNVNDVVPGTSAVLFFLSGHDNWDFERNRLQNILMALPPDSQLPLLILTDSCFNGLDSSTVVQELRLNNIDRSRIHSFTVAFLNNNQHLNVFFEDEQLRKGLQWLARESSHQPLLSCIRTRELVLMHLKSPLEAAWFHEEHGPNICINVFNTALDQSLAKIITAVHANPTSWPCPEIITFLEEYSDEYKAVSCYLPQPGWSLISRIEPLVHILTECKLPPFQYDISWLYRGADQKNIIEKQRTDLEAILINYFTDLSQVMALSLATKEVPLLLQKFVRLELRNSTYYIKPDWVKIFQRIFNWRLMELSTKVHILSKDNVTTGARNVTESPFSSMVEPSFDELLAVVGYNPPVNDSELLQLDHHIISQASSNIEKIPNITSNMMNMDEDRESSDIVVEETYKEKGGSEIAMGITRVKEQEDRLGALLERCNIVQNMIQEKLSIYFYDPIDGVPKKSLNLTHGF